MMKTAIKTEFLCVKPRSDYAQEMFEHSMYKLHSCRVVWRKNGEVGLESITNRITLQSVNLVMMIGKLLNK